MEKYRVFDKIIKTKACVYFKAENQTTHQPCVIKKLHKSTTWQELLKDKDLSVMKHGKIKNFPAIRQIVKEEQQFYIILEHMHQNLEYLIKSDIQKDTIFGIGRLLVQMAVNFAQKSIYPREVRPSHLFIDEHFTMLKLGHLETSIKDFTKLDLVQLQDFKYLSPQQVLTSKDIDERSLVFNIGLIICDLILGKSLISATTKMQYIFELTKIFPDDKIGNIEYSQHNIKQTDKNSEQTFDKLIGKYNFSNQFIGLLKQMLKLDRNQRLNVLQLLDAWDVVIENQNNFVKNLNVINHEAQLQNKPNQVQYPINDRIDFQVQFQFQEKPTISVLANIRNTTNVLPIQRNVEDDVSQPIIIRKSKNQVKSKQLNTTKDSLNRSSNTGKNPTLSTIRKPQLTNYALNQANLGVNMGMNPSIFSDND